MNKKTILWLSAIILSGCAATERGCSNFGADSFGANWIVVQYDNRMSPSHCWQLKGQSITNENGSDGIYWVSNSGNLVHISGWYNRVQVEADWNAAAKELGVELSKCPGGEYVADDPETSE